MRTVVVDVENRKEVRDLKAQLGGAFEQKQVGRRSQQNIKILHVTKVSTRDVSSDYLWGNDRCFWGAGYWDDTYTNEMVVQRVIPKDLTYEEYFINSFFEGSGSAVWDTTNNQLRG